MRNDDKKMMVMRTRGNDEDGRLRGGGVVKKRATDEADQVQYGSRSRIRGPN